ncbi:MAG: PAS domain S-box protein [Nitrososphaeria archaeon]
MDCNRSAERFLEMDALIGQKISVLKRQGKAQHLKDVLRSCDIIVDDEAEVVTGSGNSKIVRLIECPMSVGGKQLVQVIFKDVAERGKTMNALESSEALFRSLAENAGDIIYLYNIRKGFKYVSLASTKIVGYTPEEHYADRELGTKIVHPDDAPKLEDVMKRLRSGSMPVHEELRWIHKDGGIVWTEQINIPFFNSDGKLVAIEGIARDITEHKRVEGS